jgi:hypothetical protein
LNASVKEKRSKKEIAMGLLFEKASKSPRAV